MYTSFFSKEEYDECGPSGVRPLWAMSQKPATQEPNPLPSATTKSDVNELAVHRGSPALVQALAQVAKPVAILIDAVEEALPEFGQGSDPLWFLPPDPIEGVHWVLTADTTLEIGLQNYKVHTAELPPLSEVSCEALVYDKLAQRAKKLDREQAAILLGKPDGHRPLYLSLAVDQLATFGSFERVTRFIEDLPGKLPDLFSFALAALETSFGRQVIANFFGLLHCSAQGLLENELRELLGALQTY